MHVHIDLCKMGKKNAEISRAKDGERERERDKEGEPEKSQRNLQT